jgi:TolC family type I secretion outer membrane protein
LVNAIAVWGSLALAGCQSLTGAPPPCNEPGCTPPIDDKLSIPSERLGITVPPLLRSMMESGPDPTNVAAMQAEAAVRPRTAVVSLAEATRQTLRSNPDMGQVVAMLEEATAAVKTARSTLGPQVDARVGVGPGVEGSFKRIAGTDYFYGKNMQGTSRGDFALTGRQLLYDFGATASDISRANNQQTARALRVAATAEELSLRVAEVYIKTLETRRLLDLAVENVAELKGVAQLIRENATNGNATTADVRRVEARVIDAEAQRSDQEFEHQSALDRFLRVTGMRPASLRPAPDVGALIPASREAAIAQMLASNPKIEANRAAIKAARAEAESLKLTSMPKLSLDGEVSNKQFNGQQVRGEVDARGLLTLSYKVADGGYSSSVAEQASARVTQEEMRALTDQQELEFDIRQAYNGLANAKSKAVNTGAGVKASESARELYREQFKGGKRSLLELLDVQASYVSARRNAITTASEQQRSAYGVLRATGRLTRTVLAAR